MKHLTLVILFLLTTFHCLAESGYHLSVDKNGYELNIKLEFRPEIDFSNVIKTLSNNDLLPLISKSIKKVQKKDFHENSYNQYMLVSSYGISSLLVSSCTEETNNDYWKKECQLDTQVKDGGKYMVWKTDQTICYKKNSVAICDLKIKGQSKGIELFSFKLISPELFSIKAKYEALNNYFSLFYFINSKSLSVKHSQNEFFVSQLNSEMQKQLSSAKIQLHENGKYAAEYFFKVE